MNIPHNLRNDLVSELKFIIGKMESESDIFAQLYYFSAAYGKTGRLLNECWDKELVLIHLVLQGAYQAVNSRVAAMAENRERPVQLPENLPKALTTATASLAMAIAREDSAAIHESLAELAEIAYVTTGNGYYLYLKGQMKV